MLFFKKPPRKAVRRGGQFQKGDPRINREGKPKQPKEGDPVIIIGEPLTTYPGVVPKRGFTLSIPLMAGPEEEPSEPTEALRECQPITGITGSANLS